MIHLRPDTDLSDLLRRAFDMSRPQGLGYLHHRPEPLTDAEADLCFEGGPVAASADYIRGRSVKLTVWRRKDAPGYEVHDHWFDHSDTAWAELLAPYRVTP